MAEPAEEAAVRLDLKVSAKGQEWVRKLIKVKLSDKEFARGALRSAFHVKVQNGNNWEPWVAKKYIKATENEKKLFEDDIMTQVISKQFADQYNKFQMPKTVDFVVPFLMEVTRDGKTLLYCVESYIPGEYQKHSNNSGFVDVEHVRNTPHSFSHFTFERSGGQLLVCDIQGVNDLYTDPTVHTASGVEFGGNNLGIKGMALFLYSHSCTPLCEKLRLQPFDLWAPNKTPGAAAAPPRLALMRGTTMSKSYEKALVSNLKELRLAPPTAEGAQIKLGAPPTSVPKDGPLSVVTLIHLELGKLHELGRTHILDVLFEEGHDNKTIQDEYKPNPAAAVYHFQRAAMQGSSAALLKMARILLGLDETLAEYKSVRNPDSGLKYLLLAAERGSPVGVFYAAAKMREGVGAQQPNWEQAVKLLEKYLNPPLKPATPPADEPPADPDAPPRPAPDSDTWGWEVESPKYQVMADLAKMYAVGGSGLTANAELAAEWYRSAAEEATNSGKGKLASGWYMEADKLCP
jgi:elongation factor 2 kinase